MLFLISSIAYGKGGKGKDLISVKPLKRTVERFWVADIWGELSYTFYPDKYSIRNNLYRPHGTTDLYYLEDFELASQFYDIGLKAEVYNNGFNVFKYTLGLNYSNGKFYDKKQTGSLHSHWLDMDLGVRMHYLTLGFNCSSLLHCSSKNAYESGLFRYTYCYNKFVPSGYLGLNLEFPQFMISLKANFGMHKINHDKIFALSAGSNSYQTPITLSFRVLYKFMSTCRTDNNPQWW